MHGLPEGGGSLQIGRLTDDKSGFLGGIGIASDGKTRDLLSGGLVWHSSNDGSGSGLDADLLRGYRSSFQNDGNTHVTRQSDGSIIVGDVYCRGVVAGGPSNIGRLQCYNNTGSVGFRWDGGNLFYRINEAFEALISKNADHAWSQANPGFIQIGPIIFNWGAGGVQNDGSTVFNLAKPWSGCW